MATRKNLITQERLVADLSAAGLESGAAVMVHAALGQIGWLVGGPPIVIAALRQVLGPSGTILMYAGWQDSPYTMAGWSVEKMALYRQHCPPYDRRTSPAVRDWSVLAETLRTWPGTKRSGHPDGSFCALGPAAAYLTRGHRLRYGYGRRSPLAKLVELGGRVLLLGAPLATTTLLHYAESLCQLPNKPVVRYQMPVRRAGRRLWVPVEEYDTEQGVLPGYVGDYFEDIVQSYIDAHHLAWSAVGQARSYYLPAAELVQHGVAWLEDWPGRQPPARASEPGRQEPAGRSNLE